ncbi:MAG: acetylornithine deacetylase [Inquilinaceae bacterium]
MTRDTGEALAILERLIAFDTVSAGPNRALIDWVAAYLRGHGLEPVILPDAGGGKANLLATIGPPVAGGVVLSGHTDVVPVADQSWDSDPFVLTRRGNRLCGRGTADMKGFVALTLALVPDLLNRRLSVPIHLAFSYDEEIGCLGVPHLIRHLKDHLPRPRLCVVGEPTSMAPVNAHKGLHGFRTVVTGKDAHSSAPGDGASAILHAAALIGFIDRMAREHRGRPMAEGFDPPWTTFNVGLIEGGTALNIVPRRCAFSWEFRAVPGDDPQAIANRYAGFIAEDALPRLRAETPDGLIETETLASVPPLTPDPDGPAELFARQLTGANRATTVAFATEAGLFQRAGLPTIIIGPGDIAQAHQPNEFLTLDQLAQGQAFLDRVADWATG